MKNPVDYLLTSMLKSREPSARSPGYTGPFWLSHTRKVGLSVNNRSAPVKVQKSILVLEVCKTVAKTGGLWTVFISVPGHPGMFTKTWSNEDGYRLSRSQVADIMAWMQTTVQNAILANGGVQEELWEAQEEARQTGDPRLA